MSLVTGAENEDKSSSGQPLQAYCLSQMMPYPPGDSRHGSPPAESSGQIEQWWNASPVLKRLFKLSDVETLDLGFFDAL